MQAEVSDRVDRSHATLQAYHRATMQARPTRNPAPHSYPPAGLLGRDSD